MNDTYLHRRWPYGTRLYSRVFPRGGCLGWWTEPTPKELCLRLVNQMRRGFRLTSEPGSAI